MALDLPSKARNERSDEERMEGQNARDRKIAIQQFLNANTPLILGAINSGLNIDTEAGANYLNHLISTLKTQSVEVVRSMSEGGEPDPAEVRNFRGSLAEIFGKALAGDRMPGIEEIGGAISKTLHLVDKAWDVSPFFGQTYRAKPAVRMTAIAASMELLIIAGHYSFRRDPILITGQMLDHILGCADNMQFEILPGHAPAADRQSLRQSLIKTYTHLMAHLYERKAKEVLRTLVPLSESAKLKWFRDNDPVSEIYQDFDRNARAMESFGIMVAQTIEEGAIQNIAPASKG